MSNVTLHIGGRDFTIATADGEESHVVGLSRMINSKLTVLGELAALTESRMLLFAALLLADELHEGRQTAWSNASDMEESVAERLEEVAARLEKLAETLERQPASA